MNNDNTEKVITSNVTCDRNDNIDNVKRTIGTETPHLNDESCSTGESEYESDTDSDRSKEDNKKKERKSY